MPCWWETQLGRWQGTLCLHPGDTWWKFTLWIFHGLLFQAAGTRSGTFPSVSQFVSILCGLGFVSFIRYIRTCMVLFPSPAVAGFLQHFQWEKESWGMSGRGVCRGERAGGGEEGTWGHRQVPAHRAGLWPGLMSIPPSQLRLSLHFLILSKHTHGIGFLRQIMGLRWSDVGLWGHPQQEDGRQGLVSLGPSRI